MEEKSYEKLRLYDWTVDEFLLIDWYNSLVTSGDHYVTFAPDLRYLSTFLEYFKGKVKLLYALDKHGVWFAFWVEPALSGAFFGLWIRKDRRQSPSGLRLLRRCFDETFKFVTVLIAFTKQEHVGELCERIGALYNTTIPALWNGEDVFVYSLTKDMWEKKYGNRQEQRQ